MKSALIFTILASMLLSSCSAEPQTPADHAIIKIYATSAAQPWLLKAYVCANDHSITLIVDPQNPDIYLRVGEPQILVTPAYQVGEEEILIVTSRESPIQNLSAGQAQTLFAGQADPTVQVWVFAEDEDVQIAFDQRVMIDREVTSFAKLAASPQQMSDILNAEMNSVGILPRHWKMGTVREVYSAGTVPVLAITKAGLTGAGQELIACLQK